MDTVADIAPHKNDEKTRKLGERRFGAVNWIGLKTLYMREVRRFLKVLAQTVVAPVVTTLLFLVVFLQAFGAGRAPVDGVPYAEFLAPGLIMMAILSNSFANSSSSLVIGKVQGSIVDLLMPPLSATEQTLALVGGAATRGLLVGLVTALTSMAFMAISDTPMKMANPLLVVYFSLAASLMFAMFGVIAGIWSDKFDQMAAITNFFITPLTFLSGTFYAIKNLSEPFYTISHWNPVFYLIDGFRAGFTGVNEAPLVIGVIVALVINAALAIICYLLLKSGWKLQD